MSQVTAWCLTRWRLPATVRSVIAKDTVPATVKLAREIDESASVSLSLSRPADGDGVSLGKGWLHGLVDALGSHEQGVDRPEVQHVDVAHTFLGIEVCDSNAHILVILCVRSVGNGAGTSSVASARSMHLIPTNKVSPARR